MSEWKECKLGDVITLQRGHDLTKSKMMNGTIPVAGSNGIIGHHNEATTSAPGITIGRSGNLGNAYFYKVDFWAHNTTLYVKDFKGNNELFIYYFLKTFNFKQFNVGSAVPTLNRNHIHPLDVIIPPLLEQKAIASVLSSLDDKIDLLHRQNKTLEAIAETLFRQWFVDEAKEDWKEGKLGDFIESTFGGDWGKEKEQGDFAKQVNCIRGTDIAALQGGIPTKTPIRFVKENKFEKIEPQTGDILFEISGGTEKQSTGRAYFIDNLGKQLFEYPLIFSNFCRLIRPKKKEYSLFLYLYLKYLYDQNEFFNLENGSSGIKNLDYKALFYELEYPIPKKDMAILISKKVNIYYEKIGKNKIQIRTLEQMRDTLLPKLMNGEVKVAYNGSP